jgi:hypothetical protein
VTLNENTPWMTVITCLLAVLFTVVGGVVTLVQPHTLTFELYLERTGQLALAVSALGVGRSLKKGLTRQSGAELPPSWIERAPISTITIGLMVLLAGVAGGILTIADPTRLNFADYLDKMNTFAFAVGIQGAGRAVRKGIENRGAAATESAPAMIGAGTGAAAAATDTATLSAFEAHPDHPSNGLDFGVALPEPVVAGVNGAGAAAGEDLSFLDPADVAASDDDLGADDEPPLAGEDDDELGGEAGLPSDAEEDAAPPPPGNDDELMPDDALALALADVYVLDHPAGQPSVIMPSQDKAKETVK